MAQKIYTVGADNKLLELEQSPYESEDLLQELLANHPQILGQTTRHSSGILLIKREQPVPAKDGGGGQWSLDHLFVDAESVPVLLEVKRASDTRLRREVVGQMLDYAANGVAYWPIQHLIEMFETTCAQEGIDPAHRLEGFLGADRSPEAFWKQLEANLRAGRVRMVFLADEIPAELQRIVEFLNEQLRPAEVLAIELRHYKSADGTRTLVPALLGATERAQAVKSVENTFAPLSYDEWFVALGEKHGAEAAELARKLTAALERSGYSATILKDSLRLSLATLQGRDINPFYIRLSNGALEISLDSLSRHPGYSSESERQQLLNRLKSIPGAKLTTNNLNGIPTFMLKTWARLDVLEHFVQIASDIKSRLG